jgi:NADH-quinone oxidoreductase subunit M
MLWAYQRVFHGEPDEANKSFPDLLLSERLVMVPLVLLIVFLGVYPKPVLDRVGPSVDRLLVHVEEANHAAGNTGFHVATTKDGEDLQPVPASEDESGTQSDESERSDDPTEGSGS